jgi:uncharacterized protein (DUF2236 family)
MTRPRWNDAMLDAMRLVGDAPADAAIKAVFAEGQTEAARAFLTLTQLTNNDAPVPPSLPPALRDFLETTAVQPMPHPLRIEAAQNLFADHGPEILTTLGCYALPDAYAARKGVKVLHRTAYLTKRPTQRIFRTMQMLIDVMGPGGLGPSGRGIRTTQKVRLFHATIRYHIQNDPIDKWDHSSLGVPINQEDLAGTLLTFSYLAIDGLRKLGANITSDGAAAFFESWCAVGKLLGVLPEMIPGNLEEAAELKGIISRRQLAPSDEGRDMTKALIDMLKENSPPGLSGVPVGLMRLFLEQEIADYLGIPDSELDRHIAGIIIEVGKFIDRDLEDSYWQAMIFRRYILHLIEYMIKREAGSEQDYFRIPTDLHKLWQGPDPTSEEGLWKHLVGWVSSRL